MIFEFAVKGTIRIEAASLQEAKDVLEHHIGSYIALRRLRLPLDTAALAPYPAIEDFELKLKRRKHEV